MPIAQEYNLKNEVSIIQIISFQEIFKYDNYIESLQLLLLEMLKILIT